jgi:hypothetical protein
MKIVVVVDSGCIRSVYCDEEAEVEILDYDNAEEEDGHLPPGEGKAVAAMDRDREIAEQTMHEVF